MVYSTCSMNPVENEAVIAEVLLCLIMFLHNKIQDLSNLDTLYKYIWISCHLLNIKAEK